MTWEVTNGALPAGLTLSGDGTIAGTPTAVDTATFTVKGTAEGTDPASAGTRIDTKQFTLNVNEPLAVRVSRRAAEVGVAFRAALSGSGGQGPYTWSASGLPSGLSLDSSGAITGIPTTPGAYPAKVTMTDGGRELQDARYAVLRSSEARDFDQVAAQGDGRGRLQDDLGHSRRGPPGDMDDHSRPPPGGAEARRENRKDHRDGTGRKERTRDDQGEGRRRRKLDENLRGLRGWLVPELRSPRSHPPGSAR